MRILLVDDDETYAGVVALGLEEEYGFEVARVSDGQEAIDLLKSGDRAFSVIVLDYRMPRVTGLDVLRWMQRHQISIPAFILTAAGSESVVAEAMKLDAYDYFRKEDTDIAHLAAHIIATHERHLERLAAALEADRVRQKLDGQEERKKVGELVSAMTPTLDTAFANIASELDSTGQGLFSGVPDHEREELKKLFTGMQQDFAKLQTVIGGLLSLYARLAAEKGGKGSSAGTQTASPGESATTSVDE